jgi:hypothetical protein
MRANIMADTNTSTAVFVSQARELAARVRAHLFELEDFNRDHEPPRPDWRSTITVQYGHLVKKCDWPADVEDLYIALAVFDRVIRDVEDYGASTEAGGHRLIEAFRRINRWPVPWDRPASG